MKDATTHTATITTLSHEGRGIAHVDNKTVFVFNALPGEEVHFEYTRRKQKIAEATATEHVSCSPERIAPQCDYFGLCGGCSLQHMNPDYQQRHKRESAIEQLNAHGITPEAIHPTLTGPTWGYRRKARLGAKYLAAKDCMLVGFRERQSSFLAHMDHCEILDPRIGHRIDALKAWLHSLDARASIPQIEIAMTEADVALIIRHLEPLSDADITRLHSFAKQHDFKLYLQPKGIDTIHPLDPDTTPLSYTLPDFNLRLEFQPFQFTQINETINQAMIQQAMAWLELQSTDKVLDLFCGIGNFTLPIAQQVDQVTGVEADTTAIAQAKHNAALNQIQNTTFYVGNLFEDCSALEWARQRYTKVLLDPPRSGAQAILEQLPHWQPSHLVYVSCNPATFARDAAELNKMGYALKRFGTMDMFPHTQHTEAMGLFTR